MENAVEEQQQPIKKKKSVVREYAEALGTAILIAFFLRAFVIEAFKIPSGSMIPNLLIGDHLFVNKFTYGIRFPFSHKWIYRFRNPERGESIIFIFPEDPSKDFIKRVIGLPGDRLLISGDEICVNNERLQRTPLKIQGLDKSHQYLNIIRPANAHELGRRYQVPYFPGWKDYNYYYESNNDGKKHIVQYDNFINYEEQEWTVPDDMLFAVIIGFVIVIIIFPTRKIR